MSLRSLGLVVLALGNLVLLSGCTTLVKPRSSGPPDEVAVLKERLLELQRQVTVHEVEIARLKSQVSGRANTPRVGALGVGALGVGATAPSVPPTSVIPAEDIALPSTAPPSFEDEDFEEPASGPSTTSSLSQTLPLPNDQQALYNLALEHLRERRYEVAEAGFRKLLQLYPRTDLSDNASYWLGESLYSRGEFHQAFEVFRQTVERYPEGNKLPDALLKVGLCLEQTGDRVGARDVLEEVIRRFPATAASAAAKATLEGHF